MAKGKKKGALSTAPKTLAPNATATVPVASVEIPVAAEVPPADGEKQASAAADELRSGGLDRSPNADEIHNLLYKGASGQMAVMSELLYRLLNVAVPEVDVGDDVFVVRERDEAVTRVQVKYSQARNQQNDSYVAQFSLPWKQFDQPDDTPALVYVLAIRYMDRWTDFIVIRRSVLRQIQAEHDVGSIAKKEGDPTALTLRLVFTKGNVKAKGDHSFQRYRDAFDPWPPPQL